MSNCAICSEPLRVDQKVCDVCGTSVPEASCPSPVVIPGSTQIGGSPPTPNTSVPDPSFAASDRRVCPLCSATYGPDYTDEFCRCGGELTPDVGNSPAGIGPTRTNEEALSPQAIPASDPQSASGRCAKPPAGTPCLVVYSAAREPIHYCAIDKDVILIGRSDPVRGDFPDLDLAEFFDSEVSRKVSRKHAMILRSRDKRDYALRPLAGNTGTQVENELATALQDHPLSLGTRIVLGGVVRLKFEKA